jgi:hypothetical protein
VTLIFHPYVPNFEPASRVLPTWEALGRWSERTDLDVRHQPCNTPTDYAFALAHLWGRPVTLVVVEHDVVPTDEALVQLLRCPVHFCAFDYEVADGLCWSEVEGAVAFGFAKISLAARRAVKATPAVPAVPWPQLAGVLGQRLPPPHLHRPAVVHNHHYEAL